MEVVQCNGWDHFKKTVDSIKEQHGRPELGGERQEIKVLFRGQSDSRWDLVTTLERTNCDDLTVEGYINLAYLIAPEIEKMTKHHWDLDEMGENLEEVRNGTHGLVARILSYPYLVYLRHHGFPSPLLDWTMSQWVAAYFAFEEDKDTEMVSIFMFIEHPEFGKSIIDRDVNIQTYTHEVETHSRHYAQLCQYTTATKQERGLMTFFPHADVFDRNLENQDLLFKLDVPRSARGDVLKELEEKRVTWDWLFRPEDVLIGMLKEMHFVE